MKELALDALKNYVGVQFQNRTNDIVPKKWITIYNSTAKKLEWPNKGNIQELAKTSADIQPEWSSYSFTPLCHARK